MSTTVWGNPISTNRNLALTDEQRHQFDEDGFFLVEDTLSVEETGALLTVIDQPAMNKALFQVGMAVGFAEERTLYHYLGRLHGRPVAAASLVLAAGVAGIYNVMTLPDVGRRGIGTLMTAVPLEAARAKGYHIGVLQSS